MLTADQEKRLRELAYIPEHSVGLMSGISGAEPFMFKDYLCLEGSGRLMVVGYPLEGRFEPEAFRDDLEELARSGHHRAVSTITPAPLGQKESICFEYEQDSYYTTPCEGRIKPGLWRKARKTAQSLIIRIDRDYTQEHRNITAEFLQRVKPEDRVIRLYRKAPDFLRSSQDSILISAWRKQGALCAYYVADLAPASFSSYIIGCHSKVNYAPFASDALLSELVEVSRRMDKDYIHLGLGVNDGITRFKKKWGAEPGPDFFRCETGLGKTKLIDTVLSFLKSR